LEALSDENVGKTFGNAVVPHCHYKAYNLGKGRGQSVLEIAAAMTKASGYEFKKEIVGRRAGDVPDLTADPSLAEAELGFKATRDLETMCRDLWNWQTKNPLGYDTPSNEPEPVAEVKLTAGVIGEPAESSVPAKKAEDETQ